MGLLKPGSRDRSGTYGTWIWDAAGIPPSSEASGGIYEIKGRMVFGYATGIIRSAASQAWSNPGIFMNIPLPVPAVSAPILDRYICGWWSQRGSDIFGPCRLNPSRGLMELRGSSNTGLNQGSLAADLYVHATFAYPWR